MTTKSAQATGTVVFSEDVSEEYGKLMQVAIEEVFRMMLNSDLQSSSFEKQQDLDVTAVVGLAGQLCGVFMVRCSSKAALLITGAMLGSMPEHVDRETWDAVGEICNMVAGNFKSKLMEDGDGCMLSVPTVVSGADYKVHALSNGFRTEKKFFFQNEPIWIALDLQT